MNSELVERVAKATGPDAALDAAVVAYLNDAIVKPYPPTDDFGPRNRWQFWSQDGKHFLGSESRYPVPKLTSSLEAVLALVEKERPAVSWRVGNLHPWSDRDAAFALIGTDTTEHHGANPALALLLALLRSTVREPA